MTTSERNIKERTSGPVRHKQNRFKCFFIPLGLKLSHNHSGSVLFPRTALASGDTQGFGISGGERWHCATCSRQILNDDLAPCQHSPANACMT